MPLAPGTVAVNLGCGTTVAPGWVNLDNSPTARLVALPVVPKLVGLVRRLPSWPAGMIVRDLRKPLPFANGSVDFVYSSHTLEHLTRDDAERLLREVTRVLKPGGVARIVVPDLAVGVARYVADTTSGDPNAAHGLMSMLELGRGGRRHRSSHKWMWDGASLTAAMAAAGMADARVLTGGEGQAPDLDVLDARRDHSAHVEATKPAH